MNKKLYCKLSDPEIIKISHFNLIRSTWYLNKFFAGLLFQSFPPKKCNCKTNLKTKSKLWNIRCFLDPNWWVHSPEKREKISRNCKKYGSLPVGWFLVCFVQDYSSNFVHCCLNPNRETQENNRIWIIIIFIRNPLTEIFKIFKQNVY
jgi:hypothetical protein